MSLRNLPLRLVTGAYVLHTGMDKWNATEERAKGPQAMAAGAYPVLKEVDPPVFARALSTTELAVGGALLAPFVPRRLAGAVLTAFAGGLVGMYLRTPSLHEPESIWPTSSGIAVSKDIWMLGIGLALLLDR